MNELVSLFQGLVMAVVDAWTHMGNLFPALLTLMIVDVLTGLAAAFVKQTVSSKISWNGMVRKATTILIVAASDLLEPVLGGADISQVVVVAFMIAEGLSIIENASLAGVPIPTVLSDALVHQQKQELKLPAPIAPTTTTTTTTTTRESINDDR